ncbi:hypothetical protein L6Q79_01465 [bacterium]|nr:hypothetical protein [bacterium]NUN45578.1 hypothetical protein [bacterium]
MRFVFFMVIFCLCVGLSIELAYTGIDAQTRLKLKLRKPDIVDLKFIDGGNWRYVMRNQGSLMYDSPDADQNGNHAGGEFPRGSRVTIVFAAGAWIGAIKNGVPVVSETMFGTEYQPGRILNSGVPFDQLVADSVNHPDNQVYVIDQSRSGHDWDNWTDLADHNLDGTPALLADVQTWAVFNDLDTSLDQDPSPDPGLGLEVILESFAYNLPVFENSVLLKYTVRNKTNAAYDSAYFGLWMDADVDIAGNDLVGTDSTKEIVYTYNVDETDSPKAVGISILQGAAISASKAKPLHAQKYADNKRILVFDPSDQQYKQRILQGDSILLGMTTGNYVWKAGGEYSNTVRYNALTGLAPNGINQNYLVNGWAYPSLTQLADKSPADKRMLAGCGPFVLDTNIAQEFWVSIVGGMGKDRYDAVYDLFSSHELMQAGYRGLLTQGKLAPKAPEFEVTPGDGFVQVTWDSLAERSEDAMALAGGFGQSNGFSDNFVLHDFQGYRVYRSRTGLEGSFEKLAEFDKIDGYGNVSELVLDSQGKWYYHSVYAGKNTGLQYAYVDSNVINGFTYFYKVTSYDIQPQIFGQDSIDINVGQYIKKPILLPVSTEGGLRTEPKHVTPKQAMATTKQDLNTVNVVPNPFYVMHEKGRRVYFTGLPKNCTIRIFTVAGDLVRTLTHNATSFNDRDSFDPKNPHDAPAGFTSSEYWDLMNENNYSVASGVYIALISSPLGSKSVKFAIIK